MNTFARVCLISALFVLSPFSVRAAESDHPEIRQVIESFRTSIIERDKPRFLSLFLQDNVNWQGVWEDESFARVKLKNPPAMKTRPNSPETHLTFADAFTKDDNRMEETFSNIKIDSDGDVATVVFDYIFFLNDRETNRGKECWLMVRTESDWKILSVAYSKTLPKPIEAPASDNGA